MNLKYSNLQIKLLTYIHYMHYVTVCTITLSTYIQNPIINTIFCVKRKNHFIYFIFVLQSLRKK